MSTRETGDLDGGKRDLVSLAGQVPQRIARKSTATGGTFETGCNFVDVESVCPTLRT